MSIETLANITLYATTMLWRRSTMVMSGRQIGYRLPILSRYAEWDDLTIRLLECLFTITIHSFQHYSYVTANYMYVNYVMFRYPYTWCSRVFQSCLFHPWNFGPVFSGPAISTHAILSHVFQSRVFHSRVFSRSNGSLITGCKHNMLITRCFQIHIIAFGLSSRKALVRAICSWLYIMRMGALLLLKSNEIMWIPKPKTRFRLSKNPILER